MTRPKRETNTMTNTETKTKTMTKTNSFREHLQRAILETLITILTIENLN